MALVPQSEHIPFNFSALEYVLLGRTPYLRPLEAPCPLDRQVAMDALKSVGAEALVERSVAALSGGEVLAAAPPAQAMTEANLSETYGVPVAVLQAGNRPLICLREV